MNKLYPFLKLLVVVGFTVSASSAALAQASRTWVCATCDDINPCSRTAPCKTFAGALIKTAKDGEISVLDPGGYGTLNITKSIYINGTHGAGYGSTIAALTTGFIVNITDAADVRKAVRLRALDINGVSTGTNNINILAANNVWIEDSVIDGFTGNGTTTGVGVRVSESSNGCNVFISDTVIHKVVTGVRVTTSAGFAVASIRNTTIEGTTTGVDANTGGFVTIEASRISGNTGDALKTTAAGATINVSGSVLAHNNGAAANASISGSTIRVASNQVLNNGSSFLIAAGAVVESDAENRVAGNGGGVAPNGTITKQ
jgi:hypothetical protein